MEKGSQPPAPALAAAWHNIRTAEDVTGRPKHSLIRYTRVKKLDDNEKQSLLPASYRTGEDGSDVVAASLDDTACIKKELNLERLHSIMKWMWVVGRPMPPRALHYQLLLSRDIFLTERMDMHLVWTTDRIFLKPIPRFLLEPKIWRAKSHSKSVNKCNGGLRVCALGFLFSYAALIAHESDFHIAKEKHLLPEQVTWSAWVALVKQLDTKNIYDKIDERFKYGELRLSRLNNIYRLTRWPLLLKPYMSRWHQYGDFFHDNFTWLASTTVYIVVVLTAMQVGLAADRLKSNRSFQSASYGFTVFSILGPLVAAVLITVAFLVLFVHNGRATLRFWKKRSLKVQLWEPATKKSREVATNAPV
ncbi:hypothetical protein BDR22DRAFT_881600 [Usnea florida]